MKRLTWPKTIDLLFTQFTDVELHADRHDVLKLSPEYEFDFTEQSEEIAASLFINDVKPPEELGLDGITPGWVGEVFDSADDFLQKICDLNPEGVESDRTLLWSYENTGLTGSVIKLILYRFDRNCIIIKRVDMFTMGIYAVKDFEPNSDDFTELAFRLFITEGLPGMDVEAFKLDQTHINPNSFLTHIKDWASKQEPRKLNHLYRSIKDQVEMIEGKPPQLTDDQYEAILNSELMSKSENKVELLMDIYWDLCTHEEYN